MPAFRQELELLSQHKVIHAGMEKMDDYLKACKLGESDFQMGQLKEIMDSWGPTLWEHLDDEVAELSPENMRKYWSADELRKFPI